MSYVSLFSRGVISGAKLSSAVAVQVGPIGRPQVLSLPEDGMGASYLALLGRALGNKSAAAELYPG